MSKITKDEVEHVAELGRIELEAEKKEKFTQELSDIISHVEDLESAPTENIKPISQISNLENVTREDKIEAGLSISQVLQNAPDKKDNFIKVKQIFE